jgi:multidrug resistance efflux pump
VAGTYRVGGIAAFIADADRYLLATYFQENLKYVKPGQPVEVALDLYPGQIFRGTVDSIWRGNGIGQYLPSDESYRRITVVAPRPGRTSQVLPAACPLLASSDVAVVPDMTREQLHREMKSWKAATPSSRE